MSIKIIIAALVLSIVVPFVSVYFGERKAGRVKKLLGANVVSFFTVLLFGTIMIFSGNVYADGATAKAATDMSTSIAYLAAGLVAGMSCIGAGLATGPSVAAALGALSENEGMVGKALIFVALSEGIALYGLLIAFTILGRV